ncbi:HAMP domain-containing protein [Streptomyces sp. SCUT-3]|uniref:MtrAB system histidine kinase MtrB n=1 Tax=Streptomyces TaxID=1883 RepID=UPI0015FBCDA6|nr:MtrAB system histidine kinase MtrB [Streptomyces sp. SCUT-3]QMV23206.1 HAMP domain-containing protein [Streptomyces sp. SCUT-3]
MTGGEDRAAAPRGRGADAPGGVMPLVRSSVRWGGRPVQAGVRAWRRSIQLRVVATTLMMSLAVVLVLGVVVMGQVRNGLLEAKLQSAQSQALGGFRVAQENADAAADPRSAADAGQAGRGVQEASTWLTELVQQLASGGQGLYSVVALNSDGAPGNRGARASGKVLPEESVPAELREAVEEAGGGVRQQYTTIVRPGDGPGEGQAALAIGKRLNDLNGNPYQLYYLFPFTQEEKTLSLVTGTLATAGVFVVVLLGAIAWVVVRQVVTPVRMAARIAERLAAGRLQERMKVSGEDDIARLGESFNKMAQNLQVKIQQLEELSRMQRRFVSDVSHELRTPLTTVRMAADVIHEAREDFDPVTARSAELLQNQLDRFESLLAELLEISRFDAGAAALEADEVDLRDVVRRVVEAAEPLAERKGSRIVVRGAERPVVVEADARRVERVLRNLVVNAVEHGEGRDVVVRLAASRDAVAVAVRDHGVGLKPGEATRVFNRFWRADPARARTTGGTGLGLSIALEDARLHGGWLQAWGEPGGGSQFRLTLPVTAGGPVGSSPLPLEPEDSRRNRGLSASGAPVRTAAHPPHGASPIGAAPAPRPPSVPGIGPIRPVPSAPAIPPGSPAADPASLPGGGGGDGPTVSRVVGRRDGGGTQDPPVEDGRNGR